jgi:hypothetical protein
MAPDNEIVEGGDQNGKSPRKPERRPGFRGGNLLPDMVGGRGGGVGRASDKNFCR